MAALNHARRLLELPTVNYISYRSYYWKFERFYTPPLKKPPESPYVVGPYLKPKYLPPEYITEAIKPRHINDFDYIIYKPTKIEADEQRTVKLLLIDDVEGLGVTGQIVDAPYRYGASKLVAMKKAEYATDFTLKWYQFGPKTMKSASSAISPRTVRLLKSSIFRLPIVPEVDVEPWHISLALRLSGCLCPVSAIKDSSIEEYIDEQGVAKVKCTIIINNHEEVEINLSRAKRNVQDDDEEN